MVRYARALSLLAIASCAGNPAPAAHPAPVTTAVTFPATPTKCDIEEYRRLDFWIGSWDVRDAAGKLEGTNVITREFDGCVIQQRWTSAEDPQIGASFTGYDFRKRRWYHSWVDNWGNVLFIEGEWTANGMTFQGERLTPKGESARERLVWAPRPDGSIHQLWDYSLDDGRTWKVRFEGFERRKTL